MSWDNIKDNKVLLFPIVTIIIMETFINKMRKLKGIRKMILLEEAWKAISKRRHGGISSVLLHIVRKFFRRSRGRDPGSGRYHFFLPLSRDYHQQQ